MAKLNLEDQVKQRTRTLDNNTPSVTVKDILIGDIKTKTNVRESYTAIEELKKSIERHGLLQPINVYPEGDNYIVKTGHRRLIAVSELYTQNPDRFYQIRCIITHPNDIEATQLIENIQRENLKPIELYKSLKKLKEQNLTNNQIADMLGKSKGYIEKIFTAINDLEKNPEIIKTMDTYAGVSMNDVLETKAIKDKKERTELLKKKGQGKITRKELRKKAKPEEQEIKHDKKNRQIKWDANEKKLYVKLSFVDEKVYKLVTEKLKIMLENRFEIK